MLWLAYATTQRHALGMKHDRQDGKFSQVLKWVGYLTAIFSFCATLLGTRTRSGPMSCKSSIARRPTGKCERSTKCQKSRT